MAFGCHLVDGTLYICVIKYTFDGKTVHRVYNRIDSIGSVDLSNPIQSKVQLYRAIMGAIQWNMAVVSSKHGHRVIMIII